MVPILAPLEKGAGAFIERTSSFFFTPFNIPPVVPLQYC